MVLDLFVFLFCGVFLIIFVLFLRIQRLANRHHLFSFTVVWTIIKPISKMWIISVKSKVTVKFISFVSHREQKNKSLIELLLHH